MMNPAPVAPALQPPGVVLREAIARNETIDHLRRTIAVLLRRQRGACDRAAIEDVTDDVLNETVLKALRGAATFDPGRSVNAWLAAVAKNVLLNRRRRSRHPLAHATTNARLEDLAGPPAREFDDRIERVKAAVSRLKPGQRRVIELRFFQGIRGAELAAAVKARTEGAARAVIHRALRKLRDDLRRPQPGPSARPRPGEAAGPARSVG
jgi:RNA polymerase sigma-70 factor (ECF subfamily)